MIVVKVRDRDIKAAPMGPVTTGSVGLPVSWHFSEEWDDLAKTAVFRVGNDGTEITVAVLEDLCLVPDELLVQANAGENLWIGVYGWKGTNANDTIVPEIAMPTIWTYTRIQDGSQPSGIEPPEGTPGWSAQIQNATDEALRVAHGVAADAAEGDFDGISPAVTISSITHGHSVTITDRDHPEGQSFDVLDGDSAYEQAVAGGYTGTEAQFNEELASFKSLSEETKDAAPFYAEYGVTTKAEIETAINGKRQIYVHSALGMDYAPLVGTFIYLPMFGNVPQTGYRFAAIEGTTQYIYDLRDEWSTSENDLTAPAQRAETAAAQALTRMNSADQSAQSAAGSASNASRDAGTASTAATTATTKAGEASDSATAADGSAKDSEAYAIGKRGGTDVGSTDPAYHNNAKYYAEQASGSATAASGSATSAASSATAAGNAQTAAETAQAAAEDAQEAAEAVLASIPADYTELTEDVSDLKSAVNSFGLSNNVMPYDYYSGDTYTNNGITFTKNSDGSVSSEGTATGQARYYWISELQNVELPAGEYIISGIPDGAGNRSFGLDYALGTPPFVAANFTRVYADTEITVQTGQKIAVRSWYYASYVDAGHIWQVRIASKNSTLNLNGNYTPSIFVPELYSLKATVKSYGLSSNLIPFDYYSGDTYTHNGITFTKQSDGSVHSEGTATGQARYYWISELQNVELPAGTYKLGGIPTDAGSRSFGLQYAIGTPPFVSADFVRIYTDTDITVQAGQKIAIRSWYYSGYVDAGHTWKLFIGNAEGNQNGNYSPYNFVPVIFRNEQRITELEAQNSTLADYWKTYLAGIEGTLKSALYALGNHGDSFYFFTDYHYDKNADSLNGEKLANVLQWLHDNVPAQKIVNGGDLLQTHATVDAALEELNIFYQNFHKFAPDMYNVIGNHDSNHYQEDARLTDGQMYQDLFSGFGIENNAHLEKGMYFYFDNSTQKIRYMILNTQGNYETFSTDSLQLNWMITTLSNTPSGYGVVVIPHWFFEVNEQDTSVTQMSSFGTLIKALLDAYNNKTSGTWAGQSYNFTQAAGKVIAVITGHVHREYSELSSAGYPMIGFICDAVNGSAQLTTRNLGTYTEHSMSLITINTTAKTITCTPIGAGTVRTFNYS